MFYRKEGEEMNKNVIYRALFPNGKSYIGKTKNFKERKQHHYYASHNPKSANYNIVFYLAIRKYGWENIEWSIIDSAKNYEDLNEKEIYWINYYKTYVNFENSNGYNMTLGGDDGSSPGKFMTQNEINYILQKFMETGNISEISKELSCSYNLIRKIIQGEIRTDLTGFSDLEFYKKYRKISQKYTREDVELIIKLSKEGKTTKYIEDNFNIPQKYSQDVLSGRVQTEFSGLKHITREERQYYNPVNSKMTKEEVLEIVREHNELGMNTVQIGKKHNLNSARVSEILTGKTWSKVTGIVYKKDENKLKPETVLNIVEDINNGASKKEVVEKYNIKIQNINRIMSGNRWSSITGIVQKNNK